MVVEKISRSTGSSLWQAFEHLDGLAEPSPPPHGLLRSRAGSRASRFVRKATAAV